MNTTSIPTISPANNACQALKTSLTGPMGLILLLPYLLYKLEAN
jgi:hypothetical protein